MADMRARAIIEAVDKTGATFDAIAKKMKAVDKASAAMGRASGVSKLGAQVDAVAGALKKVSAIDAFRGSQASFTASRMAFAEAKTHVARLAAEMSKAAKPTAEMARDFARAKREVKSASDAFESQASVLKGHKRALEQAGVPLAKLAAEERRLKTATDQATAALVKRHAAMDRAAGRRDAAGNLLAVGGLVVGGAAKNIGKKAVTSIAEFDIATRKQREFTDIGEGVQNKLLIPQAKKIGQETQFSNLDIVKAQTKAMQGLPTTITGDLKAEVAQGIIENVKNYALVMEADMEKSAEAIRGYLQTTGKDISTKEKALFEANKATNQLVKMAKLGGMSDEDVQQYMKFAAGPGTIGGLTPESLMSIAALARRGGLRGDEAGVFMKTVSSKLVAPTKGGIAALNASGIDHSQFVRMPDRLSTDGLQGQFRNTMGLEFSKETRAKLDKVLSDKAIISDRGKFTTAVTEAVEGQMPKTKKGTMRPADRQKVAKAAYGFHELSATSVDAEGLLDAIMGSEMTLAQLNKMFTDKHGGKAGITQKQREEYVASRKELRATGDDPDFAKKKADVIMGGVGGAIEQAKGAMETFVLNIGAANSGLIKLGAEAFSGTLDSFANLSKTSQQVATGLVAVGAGAAALYGSSKLLGLITGGPAAAALVGSATALDASAAALSLAAGRLGAGGVAGAATGAATAAGATAGAAAGGPLLGRLAFGSAIGAVALGLAKIIADYTPATPGVTRDNAQPGQPHDWGRGRRKAANDALHLETQNLKATVDGPVTATLDGSITSSVTIKVDGPGTVTGMATNSSTPLVNPNIGYGRGASAASSASP